MNNSHQELLLVDVVSSLERAEFRGRAFQMINQQTDSSQHCNNMSRGECERKSPTQWSPLASRNRITVL